MRWKVNRSENNKLTGVNDMSKHESVSRIIANKIRGLREASGWNQLELSKRADITAAALSVIEKGDRIPTIPVSNKIAKALGISLAELLGEKETSQSEKQRNESAFFRRYGGIEQLGSEERKIIEALIKKHSK